MKISAALVAVLVLISPALAQPPRPDAPNPPAPPSVAVQGSGEVRVPNTVAVVQLGFEAAGPEEPAVREDITRRSQAVLAALKEEKITRLQTTGVGIRPQFGNVQPEPGKRPAPPKITGYLGQVTVSFNTPVDEAGRIITAMMNLGANSVSNMFTEPTDEARRKAENEALSLAAKDAEAQARALLAALDLKWAGIRSIDATGEHFSPRPMPRATMMMAEDAAPSPSLDIQGGESVISRQVSMVVEFTSL
ncbi:MAG: DUF541 domain-containing protein [Chthoniobacterales bacterium]|nr:DUF541 domain-containing protein [Chthoniobacterales bacterium]